MTEFLRNCPLCNASSFKDFLTVKDYFLTGEQFNIQLCSTCGLKFVNPRPDSEEIGKYYLSDDYISHDTQKKTLFTRAYLFARQYAIRNKYSIISRFNKGNTLLDIGCGTGELLAYCQGKGLTVSGIEPSEKARNFAISTHHLKISKSLEALSESSDKYSCITMWHVLEHVHDLRVTLEKIKHLLASDGFFIMAVPNADSYDESIYQQHWAAYDVPRHLLHFNATTVKQLAEMNGFKIVETLPQKLDAYYVSTLSEKYKTGKPNYLRSIINGLRSNFHARDHNRGFSSQIFVLVPEKHGF